MTPQKPEFQKTMAQRVAGHIANPEKNRAIENGCLVAGAAVVVVYGLGYAISDFMIRIGIAKAASCSVGIPWVLLILVGTLVLPKTVGRKTTGRIWLAGAKRMGGGDS
jgi:hypothetical protein